MQKLLENITNYMDYLINECGLQVSVHFDPATFGKLPLIAVDHLLPYNVHRNLYCLQVKTDASKHCKCVAEQHALYRRSDDTPFCRICHAGIAEYIYPIAPEKQILGILAVSGYRQESEIPVRRCDILLPPLSSMLEKLLIDYSSQAESEYHKMIQYLSEYHTNITLEAFCNHFNRSRSFVSHMFKQTSGMSFRSYCNQLKLEDARKLLLQTDLPVTQIALDTGFNDVSYFIRLFRDRYATSPLQYRLQALGK